MSRVDLAALAGALAALAPLAFWALVDPIQLVEFVGATYVMLVVGVLFSRWAVATAPATPAPPAAALAALAAEEGDPPSTPTPGHRQRRSRAS